MAQKNFSASEDVSILSQGVKVEGNMNSEGNVRIDGTLIGNITVNGNLTIGETAQLNGEIKAKSVTMSGKVEGKITSSEKLKLEAQSVMRGDIIAKYLIIEEGAIFEGKSVMNSSSSGSYKHDDSKK